MQLLQGGGEGIAVSRSRGERGGGGVSRGDDRAGYSKMGMCKRGGGGGEEAEGPKRLECLQSTLRNC